MKQWKSSATNITFENAPGSYYYDKYLDFSTKKSIIEIGAYPGKNLGYFAKHFGYKPTAIDFVDNINEIQENMKMNGINNCRVLQQDFFKWNTDETFDVVCSFGFIEHFTDYRQVIQRHIDLIKQDGVLIITVPTWTLIWRCYRIIQRGYRQYRTLVEAHNSEIMTLSKFSRTMHDFDNLEILYCGKDVFPQKPCSSGYLSKFKFVLQLIFRSFIHPSLLVIAKKRGNVNP
jgi:2-polyprenyl-3-methyl-5-hydroxy-6-metoxy-1,4-benzoquinol methylase